MRQLIKLLAHPSDNMISKEEQSADFIELFFDLVFVFAITKLTSMTAHHLDGKHVLQSILIFWLLWWGWTQFTWALNFANTKIASVRMVVLLATGIAFVMASSVNYAFKNAAMWFAVPYILNRILGLWLIFKATAETDARRKGIVFYGTASLTGFAAVLIGAVAAPDQRIWWWIGAIFLDMMAGFIGGKQEGWGLQAQHFAERHGLIVIIALGESLIVAATAVDAIERSQELLIIGGLAVVVTCLLWWSYFAWISDYLEEQLIEKKGVKQGRLVRDAYSFVHFPLICGIIGMAIGLEKALSHPHDLLSIQVVLALGIGYALFVGSTTIAVWLASGNVLMPRLFILAVSVTGLWFSIEELPKLALTIIAVSLLLIAVIEWRMCKHADE